MKKLLPLVFVFSTFFLSAQTFVPDDDFEQALIDLGYDDVLDDYVLTSNIDTVIELDINGINSKTELNLTGIEDFAALRLLNCRNNNVLSNLNLGLLALLEDLNVLDCFFAPDTSNNPELRRLITGYPGSSGGPLLDLSNNPKLEVLHAGTEVDVSNNPLLKRLSFGELSIRSVDVTNNPELEYLNLCCENRNVQELDVSNNPKLIELQFSETSINILDLSNNPALEKVNGSFLFFLNLKNGNNQGLNELRVEADCVQVDDVPYAEAQTTWDIGAGSYSENCTFGGNLTFVPDDNFEQALIDRGYDDVLDDYVLTANIDTITELDIDEISRGSLDLTGIQNFVALRVLKCSGNAPIFGGNTTPFTLDTSQMSQLEELFVYDSYIILDTTNNPELRVLITGSSTLGAGSPVLDVSQNPKLEELTAGKPVNLSNNPLLRSLRFGPFALSSLDLSNNPELEFLNLGIENLGLVELDLSNNPKLIELVLGETGITSLDLSNNAMLEQVHRASFLTNLEYLNLKNGNNQILTDLNVRVSGCVQVDNVAYAESQANWNIYDGTYSENCLLNLTYVPDDNFEQALIDLGYDDVLDDYVVTTNLESIIDIDFENSEIADLTGIESMTNLVSLRLLNGTFDSLELPNNSELNTLVLKGENIKSLDLSNNLKLVTAGFSETGLTTLDLSNNPLLENVVGIDVRLQFLNLSNENNQTLGLLLVFSDCVQVDDVAYAQNQTNWSIGGGVYSENCFGTYLYTYVPDDNFEQYLIDNAYDDVLDDYVLTSNMEAITELDIRTTAIEDLTGIESMTNLESLIVLNSGLSNLDLSTNSNLTYLIVSQNENLVALNIKNGANEKLINESVFLTDNPQLFCIQVDDYLLSSSSLRWEKDDHASFSTDCTATPGDSDSDGVADASDLCPNTAPNNPVSPQGCALAQYTDLVVQNISIGVGSEPCAQGPSGYIEIGVLRDAFDLNVSIFQFENKIFEGVINANTPLFLGDLSGPYKICVSSALAPTGTEFGSYCYEAECGPFDNTLRTTVRIQNPDQVYAIAVSGSKSYAVTVNGNAYAYDFDTVEKQQLDIPLEVGINAIIVTGNIDCNGSDPDAVVQAADSIDDLILFPTLTNGKFTIANNKRHEISTVAIASLDGKRVVVMPIHNDPENITMDLSGNTNGMYIVRIVTMSGKVNTAKVIIQ